MTLVKIVISEKADINIKHEYFPISTALKDEGPKKPNSLISVFQISNIVKEGDFIEYIQDMVDVNFLRAIYNFHLSALDDRGYNVNPNTDPPASRFDIVDNGKFLGNYAIDFVNGNDDFITVENSNIIGINENTTPSEPRVNIDLQGQFDISIWFTPDRVQQNDDTDEPILWSYFDSPTGLEIGITGMNGNDASWRGFARIGNGSTIEIMTGSSQTVFNETSGNNDPVLIRVYRGDDDIIRMDINGVEDTTRTESADLNPTSQDMFFGGGGPAESDKNYNGLIHQIRIYCGETLTIQQADIVRWAKPQAFTKKFSGKIWRVKDNEVSKIAYALANSQGLLTLKLNSQIAHPLPDNPVDPETLTQILQSVIDKINLDTSTRDFTLKIAPDVTFDFVPITPPNTLIGTMYEIGSFLEFINILLVWTQTVFYTTSNNLLIIEPKAGRDSNIIFDQDSQTTPYDVTVSESNDNNNINQIILTGRSGITFETGPSVNDLRRTLRKNVLQLDDSGDLSAYGFSQLDESWGTENFPNANSLPEPRFDIKITSLLNSVRYNQKVNIVNSRKDIDIDTPISQIDTSYPSGNMTIKCNNTDIDYYDSIQLTITSKNELQDNVLS